MTTRAVPHLQGHAAMGAAGGHCETAPFVLAAAPRRSEYVIAGVTGPEQRRLCEMGFVEGAPVSIVNKASNGMMVVKLGGCRLALAHGMADCVLVR